jgi:hypothetical protein
MKNPVVPGAEHDQIAEVRWSLIGPKTDVMGMHPSPMVTGRELAATIAL